MCKAKTASGHTCKKSSMFGTDRCWTHAQSCSICLEKVGVGDDSSKLQCGHWYHSSCIYKWLERDHRCPMCRQDTRHKMNVTVHYDDEADLPEEGLVIDTLRNLTQRNMVHEEVWIRRAFVFYNHEGQLVAALDQV